MTRTDQIAVKRPKVIKKSSCFTQPSMKFILLINIKMPTTVGILTFISRINTTERKKIFIFHHFTFYKQLKFHTQLSLALKSFMINLGLG